MNRQYEIMKEMVMSNVHYGIVSPHDVHKRQLMRQTFYDMRDIGIVDHLLVIAPMQLLKHDWLTPDTIKTQFLHGRRWEKLKILKSLPDTLYINPEGIKWLEEHKDLIPPRTMLVVDFPTTFKAPKAQKTKLLHSILPLFDRRYFLTSHMFSYDLMDIFGSMFILDEGKSLGTDFWKFRGRYFYPTGEYTWAPRPSAKDEVIEKINHLIGVIHHDFVTDKWEIGEL